MDIQQAKAAITIPQVNRLKDLGMGLKMGRVFGTRVLVQPVNPFTEVDRLEKEGLLYAPKNAKDQATPLPSTGVVLQLGEGLINQFKGSGTHISYWVGKRDGRDIEVEVTENDEYFNVSGLRRESRIMYVEEQNWPLRVGDMVMFSKYAGSEPTVEQVTYRMLNFSEIMCTLIATEPEAYAVTTD
jgi:co-chaperonin GroES (HSP10)